MLPDNEAAAAEAAQENEDLVSGFSDEPSKKTATKPAKPEPAAPDKAPAAAEDKPEYVQVTAKELADIRAAAAKTASYDQQLSRVFGTLGNLQKLVAGLPKEAAIATPAARKVEIPKEAFAEMERDFPELAKLNRSALEAVLSSMQGTGANDADESKLKKMLETVVAAGRVEDLEDAYPDWRTIVGAVDVTKEQPDPNNAFRRWLATKDAEYQTRINSTENANVIQRSIALFRRETRTAPKPVAEKPRDARADRFRNAVQPKGDGGGAPPGKSENEEFEAGYASARS
jgi:hypothetical protein